MSQLNFAEENRERIRAVEASFGSAGKPLYQDGRILIGEGKLMKQSRRGLQPKVFFLFNDMLVYGSIILNGRWYTKQQIIPLEAIQLKDKKDSIDSTNQWLIRTPRKSFFVEASCEEEKQAWIDHMIDCQSKLLQRGQCTLRSNFAVTWVPDEASPTCMRCDYKFTLTHRRHHCRNCGLLVCATCSKKRGVIEHIHPTKPLRLCEECHGKLANGNAKNLRQRGDSDGRSSSDEDGAEWYSVEEETGEDEEQMSSWVSYSYLTPQHFKP
ncbi:pleckstrin homology domain-containing family F member 1 [Kryptolebias marmoratus]|uniref:Pleckstrin homology and FYVE domain containing 1 n=1 Tax=Kryptolebias marmoratus TaxID=37003 RepID=A0A3Q3AIC6_KRYMA|nr:pleckstrin homology domain-containing family F member 1 [Kryptolebias marmoratus]